MYRLRNGLAAIAAILATGGLLAVPVTASAQSWRDLEKEISKRQKNKNDWRNIATASGITGVYGLLKGDRTLFFLGTAGALYSANRYEQDRKSQSRADRARASYFSRGTYVHNDQRYKRRTVTKNGKKYYQFVRVR